MWAKKIDAKTIHPYIVLVGFHGLAYSNSYGTLDGLERWQSDDDFPQMAAVHADDCHFSVTFYYRRMVMERRP